MRRSIGLGRGSGGPSITVYASMVGRMPQDHNPPGGISTRLVSLAADCADLAGINDYDSFAEAYAASTETSLINACYERPAMLALAWDVAGRRILDDIRSVQAGRCAAAVAAVAAAAVSRTG